jgi:spore coat protein U-like protein
VRACLASGTALAAATLLQAATIPTTASFAVGATIASGCIVAGNPGQVTGLAFGQLSFGTYSAMATGSKSASLTSVANQALLQCTPGTAVQVTADAGLSAVGNQRRLAAGAGQYLPYSLFLTSNGSQPLTPGVAVGLTLGATATALPLTGTVILPGSGLAAGTYVDTVRVTLTW